LKQLRPSNGTPHRLLLLLLLHVATPAMQSVHHHPGPRPNAPDRPCAVPDSALLLLLPLLVCSAVVAGVGARVELLRNAAEVAAVVLAAVVVPVVVEVDVLVLVVVVVVYAAG